MSKIFNEVHQLPKFKKDLKKLSKKHKTLPEDLEIFIDKQLKLFHKLKIDNGGVVRISDLGVNYPEIYKARKFACRSLKGTGSRSGIRIIYAYYPDQEKIEFIEIYYKGDTDNENRQRILEYYKKEI
ncbi:MAG: hypothetical protein KKC11_04545 [Candidatus Omnitrophica bacterium]|nr:hypothetical protein [Candidatus Omnitrophota bacterium]MBU0878453.1 hypothetical protein [Candidatus Omnitrophota bacterium]MBU0896646.1 hypothetical protein [Candidatus Omnitrophota bacterium]MBU1133516.1 hypothetical protein [Candidatus Omnitrophota bacterium]MBU1810870.1 hypothetical protein [Candidatus Omnitrophota bacterium]